MLIRGWVIKSDGGGMAGVVLPVGGLIRWIGEFTFRAKNTRYFFFFLLSLSGIEIRISQKVVSKGWEWGKGR